MDPLLEQVLRIHPEPCTHVGDREVHQRLTARPGEFVGFVAERLQEIAVGKASVELPFKQVLSNGVGDFRTMPCIVQRGSVALKTVKIVGTNTVQLAVPDQITVGRAFRLDADENYITHTFDACLLSSARTGVCATIALQRLAPVRREIGIVGAGRVGFYTALYAATLDGVEDVFLHDPHEDRAAATVELLRRDVRNRVRFRVGTGGGLRAHDALVLCTMAREPLFDPPDLEARLVVSAGADVPEQRELGAAWADVADIYVDSMDALATGDLRAWKAEGAISDDRPVDLIGLLRDGPRENAGRRRVFISTGSALFDNITIGYLLGGADPA